MLFSAHGKTWKFHKIKNQSPEGSKAKEITANYSFQLKFRAVNVLLKLLSNLSSGCVFFQVCS